MHIPAADSAMLLADAASDWWAKTMERYPTWASYLGDRRYDDRLTDISPAARKAWVDYASTMKGRLDAIDAERLGASDRVTWDMLRTAVVDTIDGEVCRSEQWEVDQLGGVQVNLGEIPTFHTVQSAKDAKTLIARYTAAGGVLAQHVTNLRAGLAAGLTAARINVERVIAQIDGMIATPPDKSPFMELKIATEQESARPVILTAVREYVYGGLTVYRDFLKNEYLARARGEVGVKALPIGEACYAFMIRAHTGSEVAPQKLHQLGLDELARIHGEMAKIIREVDGTTDVAAFLAAIPKRKDQYMATGAELLLHNQKLLARAAEALPRAFGRLPKIPCEVKAIEPYREKDAPAAYYYGAPDDGSRPAYYYLNTFEPETRPLYDMEALAFHEAVPGHHLQIALAQELKDVPDFRRHTGQTAFIEGWALYAEGLADELGLYSGPLTRFGMLNYEAWRAARLVVDTGMHALGWTREQALSFMGKNTALHLEDAANEIDRYIVWPGQALAYKVGQLTFRELRADAEKRLGAKFDLRAFHDAALAQGAVPMATLRREMARWIAERERS